MVMSDQGSGGLLLAALGLARDEGRGDVVLDDLPGDDHLGDVAPRRDVVHHVEEDLLDDRAQAAGAGAALEGRLGDRVDGVVGELELDAVEVEELLVLLDERVARLGEDLDERLAVELAHAGDERQPADELGDQAELGEVLGADLGQQVVGLALGGASHLGGEAQRLLAHALLEAGERPAHDEQDVGGVDLDELLVRVLAPALRGHRRGRALQHLEQGLLDALTGDVAGDRGVLRLAGHLVDLVDVDDARLGLLDVVVGSLDELEEDVLDILADVAGLGQRRGVRDREGDVEHPRQGLREVGLASTGRPDHQDVGLRDLDHVVLRLAADGLEAGLDALVVVVDRDGEGLLGVLLADHVGVEELEDLAGLGQLLEADLGTLGQLLLDDLVAQLDALIADVDVGASDELLDLLLALSAEIALEQVATVTDTCHESCPPVSPGKAPALHTLRCAALQWAVRRYPGPAPVGGRTRDVVDHHFAASAHRPARAGAPLRDSMTASISPYSTACSAVRILSRSMSALTWSMDLPEESAIICSSSSRMRRISLAWISMSEVWPNVPSV